MVFGIYDTLKSGKVNYSVFFSDLVEELPPIRKNLTSAAFKHLDVNRNGFLDLEEIKGKFLIKLLSGYILKHKYLITYLPIQFVFDWLLCVKCWIC